MASELMDILIEIKRGYESRELTMYDDSMISLAERLTTSHDALIEAVVKAEMFDQVSPAAIMKEANERIEEVLASANSIEPASLKDVKPAKAKCMFELSMAHISPEDLKTLGEVYDDQRFLLGLSYVLSDSGIYLDLRELEGQGHESVRKYMSARGLSEEFGSLVFHCLEESATAVRFDIANDEVLPKLPLYQEALSRRINEGNWPFESGNNFKM